MCIRDRSKGKGLEPLQQQKGVKGGNRRPGIPQEDRPDIGGEGSLARGIGKGNTMIAGIRLGELRKPSGGLPVEGAAVYDDAAQGGAVSADKFGSRVNHNIRAMLNGPDQIGGCLLYTSHQQGLPGPYSHLSVGPLAVRLRLQKISPGKGFERRGVESSGDPYPIL